MKTRFRANLMPPERCKRTDAMTSRTRSNDKALAAFMARKAEIDTMLARLQALSDEHFEANPEDINWGDVGTLEHYANLLKRLTDSAFCEGEHAE
jgi:hypothetical protein